MARGRRVLRTLSIVGGFCRLPWQGFVGGLVASPVCHLALVAARGPLAVSGEDATSVVIGGTASVGATEPSPRCGVRALLRAFRTIRFTLSIKAVFSLPERPNPCKLARISVFCPQPHHVSHPNQLAPPVIFLDLAVDQTCLHLPPTLVPPSASLFSPFPKMRREPRRSTDLSRHW